MCETLRMDLPETGGWDGGCCGGCAPETGAWATACGPVTGGAWLPFALFGGDVVWLGFAAEFTGEFAVGWWCVGGGIGCPVSFSKKNWND